MKKNLFLVGPPGCGKTSLILKVLEKLKDIKAAGFTTSEIRERGMRMGFKITSLDGEEAILAHVNLKSPFRVSKYGVSIENLEKVGLEALRKAVEFADLIVIDEIGKMELFSEELKNEIHKILNGKKPVLGTIMQASHPFAEEVKRRRDVEILMLNHENWNKVLDEILVWVNQRKAGE